MKFCEIQYFMKRVKHGLLDKIDIEILHCFKYLSDKCGKVLYFSVHDP